MKSIQIQVVTAIFCFATIVACNHDDKAREEATTEALQSINTPPQPPTASETVTPPSESSMPKDTRAKTAGTMNLTISGGSASKGSDVCVAVKAKNFKSIVSMQYSLKWDPKVLKFKELKGFNLPQLGVENFGRHILDKGQLTYSWYDANVKGITRADGDNLYEICFEAIGEPGNKSAVQIVDTPTIIEIANVNSEFYTLDAIPGTVLVK